MRNLINPDDAPALLASLSPHEQTRVCRDQIDRWAAERDARNTPRTRYAVTWWTEAAMVADDGFPPRDGRVAEITIWPRSPRTSREARRYVS